MTDRTAPSSDARKRRHEREMADAHATARARDARVEESFEERAERYGLDWDVVAHLMSEQPTRRAYRTRTQAIDPETGTFTPLTQEPPMTKHDRHDELVAPIDHRAEAERLLSQAEDTAVPMTTTIGLGTVANTHVLLAMLDLLDSRLTAPRKVDPDLAARNIAALKHELETPMREHGECCEPAPADVDPDEALAKVLHDADSNGHFSWEGTGLETRADYLRMARAAREHIEAEQEEVVATLREEVAIQTARAEQAEVWMSKWQQSSNDARDERDALRERLDALRADVTRFHEMWGGGEIERLAKSDFAECLARGDERAAKGEQR